MKSYFIFFSLLFLFLSSHTLWATSLETGKWRFELQSTHATIPFITELIVSKNKITGTLFNGREKIQLKNISRRSGKIIIPLQTYEISMELDILNSKHLKGFWIRHNKDPKIILPIEAFHGVSERFLTKIEAPTINLNGKWEVSLKDDAGVLTKGLLTLTQDKNAISGSLMTPTGDYRYMEGYVSKNVFELASFDGMFNYLFKGEIQKDRLSAELLSTYALSVTGKRNDDFKLPDPYKATQITAALKFSFPDLKGNLVALSDKKFLNKPVILQFFGSWCPNCIDEMNYLIPWYKKNQKRGIEIIALAFERSLSENAAKIQLKKVQKNFQLPYTLLLAGSTPADKPADKIEGLKNFISFPTTVFLNKKHEIQKIHAGFSGPGTGEFFEQWKKEFNENMNELLK